ncbi:MAG: GntR family transcriptional regulator [Kiritimatiellae bacterium]|nr:GntR family transcriptional regulator [Kiritimatiellia bacterium]
MTGRPSAKLRAWLERQLGVLAPGQRLPTDPQLAEMFGLSEITVRRILKTYRDRHMLSRIPGKGTFVAGSESEEPPELETPGTSAENIADHILNSIHSGMIRRGQALPPVKQVVYRFNVSPGSVRQAYKILEGQGLVTRVGRTFWVGDFTEAMTPERTRDVLLLMHDSSDYQAVFEDEQLAQAYQRMERELLARGFVLQFDNTANLDRLLRYWRAQRRLPAGFIFHRVLEQKYEQVRVRMVRVLRLAEMLGQPRPAMLLDWWTGEIRPRVGGVHILSRGNLSTITARVLAQYLMRMGYGEACFFVDDASASLAWAGKLRAELKHLRPAFAFRPVVLGARHTREKAALAAHVRAGMDKTRFLEPILGKYQPVPVADFKNELVVATDYDEVRRRLPAAGIWVFQRDRPAAAAVEWGRASGIEIPQQLSIVSHQRTPAYYHLGLSCCFPDYEQIGYQMAHAIIGDFPVATTSKGFIRTNALVAERLTTRRLPWEPVGELGIDY